MSTFPEPLYLLFKHITPLDQYDFERDMLCWKPPSARHKYAEWDPDYFEWRSNSLTAVNSKVMQSMEVYRTSSMFWCSECQGYIQVPYDCTKHDVEEKVKEHDWNAWKLLSFRPHSDELDDGDQCIDLAGHIADGCRNNTLSAPAPRRWKSLLPARNNRLDLSNHPGFSKLAGNLSVLFGLMAFSVPKLQIQNAIDENFTPGGEWTLPSDPPYTGNHKRGMVVSVLYNPHEITSTVLEDWEEGKNGPIIR